MTCEEAQLAISAALDGELSPGERATLSEHLMQCESCRALAEDLRVLTGALEDSDREPPAGLAESVRKAVAEEPQPVPAPKKRRPPYLRSLAAMVALCAGLGCIGLFAAGQGGGKSGSAANGAAPALYQAAPEGREKSVPAASDGVSDSCTGGAVGYSATEDGDPAEAPMEAADEEAPQLAPAGAPVPSSAPAPQAAAGIHNYSGGTEENAPDSGSEGGGPTADSTGPAAGSGGPGAVRMEGEEKLAITPEEALELVFEYVGGYEQYPEALRYDTASDGTQMLGYTLQIVESEAVRSEYCLHYTGLSGDGGSYQFHLYEDVTGKADGTGHTATTNWIEVSMNSGEITTMF